MLNAKAYELKMNKRISRLMKSGRHNESRKRY